MTDRKTAAVARDDAWITPDGATLVVLSGGAKGASIPLPGEVGQAVTVGNGADQTLVLPDATVSRQHFRVTRTDRGLHLTDSGSTNGVRVGDVVVREAMLEPGVRIVAGDVALLVTVESRGAVVPPSAASRFGSALGGSLAMRRTFGILERAAGGDVAVLLVGEPGTGKGTLARALHDAGPRGAKPFVALDCGALEAGDGELLAALAAAAGGTLFLDDVDALAAAQQASLARALEQQAASAQKADAARVVAASARDLRELAQSGAFREDLYFLLAVVTAPVPALRARLDDLPLLVEALLPRADDGTAMRVSADAMRELRGYDWPGNVRELRNVLERSVAMARASGEGEVKGFFLKATREGHEGALLEFAHGVSYRDARARVESAFEAAFVRWICDAHRGNVSAAARAAKMDRKYLAELIRKHGVRT